MTAYLGTAELRTYLGMGTSSGTADDALLGSLIVAAQTGIETYCRRTFAATAATQYFSQFTVQQTDGYLIHLDDDLYGVSQLVNGNGATIPAGSYWLEPRNEGPPYAAIRLKSSQVWTWNTDGEISIAGTVGYSLTPPHDIVMATKRWAAQMYRGKDAANQFANVTAFAEAGQMIIEKGMPADVETLIKPYRRSQYG